MVNKEWFENPANAEKVMLWKQKQSETRKRLYVEGLIHPMKGKHHTDEARRIIGEKNAANKESHIKQSETMNRKFSEGYVNPMKGKKRPDMSGENSPSKRPEARNKNSEAHKGYRNFNYGKKGNLSLFWKGGPILSMARKELNRRNLGFVPLNQYFNDADGHHIDKEHIIYIPRELHHSVWHRLNRPETMERINTKVYCWLLGLK